MSKHSRSLFALLLPAFLLLLSPIAHATEITKAGWEGKDFILRLSDSISYRVDLLESDSNEVIVRLNGVTMPRRRDLIGAILGPGGMTAIISPAGDDAVRLTMRADGRLGYSTRWQPYSHSLIVHTFDWKRLDYPEEQYHKGLLALEQGMHEQAAEMLAIASATGNERAASALGILYAQRGNDSLAIRYLDAPADADAYAALADVQRRLGNSEAAAESEEKSGRMIAGDENSSDPRDGDSTAQAEGIANADELMVIGLSVLAALILLGVIVAMSRRSRSQSAQLPPPPATWRPYESGEPRPASNASYYDAVRRPEETGYQPGPASREAYVPAQPAPAPPPAPVAAEQARQHEPERTAAQAQAPVAPDPQQEPAIDDRDRMPAQAMELRERIQASRTAPGSSETTISAARRLNVSRDNVELRKRMEAARKRDER